jgi:hypothetical protein
MTRTKITEWVNEHAFELQDLFMDLEESLRKMDLLVSDFDQYKQFHFNRFCEEVYRLANGPL